MRMNIVHGRNGHGELSVPDLDEMSFHFQNR